MFDMDFNDSFSSSTSSIDLDEHSISDVSDTSSSCSRRSELSHMANSTDPEDDKANNLIKFDAENEAAECMIFKNTSALCDDLRFITEMPEMCDVKCLVGKDKVPVYGVKAILATRSRAFFNLIISQERSDIQEMKTQKKKRHLFTKLRKFIKQKKDRDVSISGNSSSGHLTIDIEMFDPDTFRRVIIYLHSGNISVNVHSVIGVMIIAETYSLENLRSACFEFACRFINLTTVLQLFSSTRQYSSSKSTKLVLIKIFDFICENAESLLRLPIFENVSKETAILILARPDLRATEETKWDAALNWSRRHCGAGDLRLLQDTLILFTPRINFCEVSLSKLTQEIRPLSILPDDVIDQAVEFKSRSRHLNGLERIPFVTKHQRLARYPSVQSITSINSNESLVGGYFSQGCQSTDSGLSVCSSENSSLLSNIW